MKIQFTLIFIFLGIVLFSQEYYDDAQIRAYLNVEKKITKKFFVHIDQQYRFTNNVSEFNRGSVEIGATWKPVKFFKLQGNYTFIQNHKNSGRYATRHWYSAAAIFKGEIDRWKFIYRNLFQVRSGDVNSDEMRQFRFYDRNKFIVKYEATKRFTFYVAEELYVPLNSPQAKGIDRSRSFIGTEIVTCKDQSLELFFMYQVRLQPNEWFEQKKTYPNKLLKRDFIYGISYNISF
ncbi:MAG: hypothetical protein K0S32_463 [Bacteroidetes bacterium]|jgi:hypothetical protein|nr:hypothetical protein [Bacteroidota bacterium]